jgi:hemerythrin-like metal-binding protein
MIMDKRQEILEVSKLLFELTMVGDTQGNLDFLLQRLLDLLEKLGDIRVLPKAQIHLLTPRQSCIQVAQVGLKALWELEDARQGFWEGELASTVVLQHRTPPGDTTLQACFDLPLKDGDRLFGVVSLYIQPDWQPSAIELEFMQDLSKALSSLVSRSLINEVLRVREIELENARSDAIRRLGAASEYRDNDTGMHVVRMTNFAHCVAKAMGLPLEERETIYITAPMHDVGKIGIPDAILQKPGLLDVEEYSVMKTHAEIGERLLQGGDPLMVRAREIAVSHHENWDGSGYPRGIKGEEIPLLGRICSIADVFDALTSARPYKKPWPVQEAVDWIHSQSGLKFDPAVVNAFDAALPEILRIRELYRDDIIDPNEILDLPELPQREEGWVTWDDSLTVGIDGIDEHHRYLFDLTNDLFNTVKNKRGIRQVARVLKALEHYVKVHFRAEEMMMSRFGYARLPDQLDQHAAFELQLEAFYAELHENPIAAQFDVLIFLKDWLIHHIAIEDAQLHTLVTDNRKAD